MKDNNPRRFSIKMKPFFYRLFNRNSDATTYLLKSQANATRLLKGLEDYKNGLGRKEALLTSEMHELLKKTHYKIPVDDKKLDEIIKYFKPITV